MRTIVLIAVLSVFVSLHGGQTPPSNSGWGTVEGTVLDPNDKPLPGATVTSYMDAKGQARDANQFKADDSGKFSFKLPPGSAWLCADKATEGYPYPFFSFYKADGQNFPTIQVNAGKVTKDVVIRVGHRAAHLVYEATDADGNLVAGRFEFVRLDQPGSPFSTSAQSKDDLLVPTSPFRMTFDAKGFKPWHYDGVVSLKPDGVLNVAIKLQRE